MGAASTERSLMQAATILRVLGARLSSSLWKENGGGTLSHGKLPRPPVVYRSPWI